MEVAKLQVYALGARAMENEIIFFDLPGEVRGSAGVILIALLGGPGAERGRR